MSGELAPVGHQQFFGSDGLPLASGHLITSQSGGATPLATYADALLSSSNGTTIELNGAGRPSVTGTEVALFLDPTKAYRFTLKDSSGATIWTCDNIGAATAGTYTPTLTNVTNLDASTSAPCFYMRVGNTVFVQGIIIVDPTTASNTATEVDISLPIASNLTTSTDVSGFCSATDSTISEHGFINADTSNDRAKAQFKAGSAANHGLSFSFSYMVQ